MSATLQKKVDQFIRLQRRKRVQSNDRDLTLTEMIANTPPLDTQWVVQGVRRTGGEIELAAAQSEFTEAVKRLNNLNQAKRLFVLETINLLGSAEGIENLLGSLSAKRAEERRRLAMSFILAFRGTDRVTDHLVKAKHLFNPKTIDSQTHGLVSFRFEMAEKLLGLFAPRFMNQRAKELGIDPDMALDVLRGILEDAELVNLSKFLIGDDELKERLPRVIGSIQGHRMLPIYAKKRYDYLRDFFVKLTAPGRIAGADGGDISKICAAFLWTNQQLIPPRGLISSMLKISEYAQPSTKNQLFSFLERLAPTTVDALIKDIKDLIQALLKEPKPDLEQLFAAAKAKYERGEEDHSLFGQVYTGLMDLKAMGWVAFKGVEELFEKLRNDIAGQEDAQASLEEVFNAAADVDDMEPPLVIDKHAEFTRLFRKMRPVNTTVDGFRGPREGAGKRAAQVNQRIFDSNESALAFKEGLALLLDYFTEETSVVKIYEFKPPKFPKQVTESHCTFLAYDEDEDPLLLCLGITYFEQDGGGGAAADDLDLMVARHMLPYFFTMVSGNFNTVLHARSRKVELEMEDDEDEESTDAQLNMLEFKAADLTHAEYFRDAARHTLALFHGLPENLWRSPEAQKSVAQLFDKLKLAY